MKLSDSNKIRTQEIISKMHSAMNQLGDLLIEARRQNEMTPEEAWPIFELKTVICFKIADLSQVFPRK